MVFVKTGIAYFFLGTYSYYVKFVDEILAEITIASHSKRSRYMPIF
jgi:hypothetical protein